MILAVSGIMNTKPNNQNLYQEQHYATKYYQPQTRKDEVKKDFGMILDAEIRKLTINILI